MLKTVGKVWGSGVTGSSVYLEIAYAERSRGSVGAGRQQEAPMGRERKSGGAAATADRFDGETGARRRVLHSANCPGQPQASSTILGAR